MGSWKMCLVSKWASFHFRDSGRKGNQPVFSQNQETPCYPRDPITETENGFMEPKHFAFCFGDCTPLAHPLTRRLDHLTSLDI